VECGMLKVGRFRIIGGEERFGGGGHVAQWIAGGSGSGAVAMVALWPCCRLAYGWWSGRTGLALVGGSLAAAELCWMYCFGGY
jgi:hypothetical protein